MWGYQAPCSQDGGGKTWKEDIVNNCSKQDFIMSISLLIIVARTLKLLVVRDLFKPLHLDDMVRYRMIVRA